MTAVWLVAGIMIGLIVAAIASGVADDWMKNKKKGR